MTSDIGVVRPRKQASSLGAFVCLCQRSCQPWVFYVSHFSCMHPSEFGGHTSRNLLPSRGLIKSTYRLHRSVEPKECHDAEDSDDGGSDPENTKVSV